jgi:pimeloyl-ACP methyl ester carboxylesterase
MALTEEGTSKFIQAGPLKLHYHEAGQGPALVMIHGGGPGAGGWSNYRRNVDHFAGHFRVILPDLPGFAKSDKPKIESGLLGFMAKAIHDLMDALDIPRANFIGNSLGGGTTLKFALDYPDRAQRLVLMGAPGWRSSLRSPPRASSICSSTTRNRDPRWKSCATFST